MEKLVSVKELFVNSFEIYKSKFLLMTALVVIPLVAFLAGGIVLAPLALIVALSGLNIIFVLVGGLVFLVILLAWLIIYLLSYIALFYCLKENPPLTMENIKGLFLRAWSVVGSYAWVAFLAGIIALLGFILLIIPGIIFSVWVCFSSFVLIFEGVRGLKAIKKSKELVKGYWWPIFGRLAALTVAAILVSMIPVVGDAINLICVAPFGLIYMYLLYEDIKKKKTLSV
ncbi:MAG: hypothetical protein Q7S10_01170 [bacterium]|nr:hypothetical protein [bacterium]